ncbi:SANT and BTB domain regulator of class switch recombination-like [Schistocerca nitens]|uniref:SANT and BTB domain regulator of class switch recombination-like n=1 Tax=Schistocerca nitens TaxID=7011 RepID=UPI0021197845|nr:SANT and BTB domain regulator of class switch recombination-like [Schistocerca nitens]
MAKINTDNTTSATSKSKSFSQASISNRKGIGSKHSNRNDKRACTEISFKDFLCFLRTAYQINENVNGNSTDVAIDWQEVAANELVSTLMGLNYPELPKRVQLNKESSEENIEEETKTENENKIQTIDNASCSPLERLKKNRKDAISELIANKRLLDGCKNMEHLMKRKLNEVIQEGLLDSVLPYVVPKLGVSHQQQNKKTHSGESKKSSEKHSHHQQVHREKNIGGRRKSSGGDIEVEIHVCDEVKNLKRDFKCSQKLLVSKMGYFAEVTTGQKLEDMDISVHCDITIFDWLMRWVKKDINTEQCAPKLDAANVIPILVSAAFLQMDPLLEDCLEFCRNNMNEIVKASTNLSCLNDSILTRLAGLFSNSEVEALRDRKDKVQSRLYSKLIASLAEPTPEIARGHYASLAHLYKCANCGKLIVRQIASHIPCQPANMLIDIYGNISSKHIRDSNWNLNDYVQQLRHELRTWRLVYWRLWGDCHFLRCTACTRHFPIHQVRWCCHHPDQPQFFSMEQQRTTTFPIGRYPCCGERAYRFEVISSESGCQFRDHEPDLQTERDIAVHKIFTQHMKLTAVEPPQLMLAERLTRFVNTRVPDCLETGRSANREAHWWEGLELAPKQTRQGLLSKIWDPQQLEKKETGSTLELQMSGISAACSRSPSRPPDSNTLTVDADQQQSIVDSDSDGSSDLGDSDVSEESGGCQMPAVRVSTRPRQDRPGHTAYVAGSNHSGPSQWLSVLSTRNNQDNQREYEERAMQQISTLLTRRMCAEGTAMFGRMGGTAHRHHRWSPHSVPAGGTYIRLEHEWKEAHCHSHIHGCQASSSGRQRTNVSSTSATTSCTGMSMSARHRVRGRR